MTWLLLSLIAALLGGIASFMIFILGTHMKEKKPLATNLAYYGVMAMIGLGLLWANPDGELFKDYRRDTGRILSNENNMGLQALITATAFIIGNVALFTSYYSAPNPGLCDGIASFSGVLVFLYGVLIFGKKYTFTHVIGVLLIVASVFLIGG